MNIQRGGFLPPRFFFADRMEVLLPWNTLAD